MSAALITRPLLLLGSMLLFLSSSMRAQDGHLFILGGGDRPASLMTEFITLAGGPEHARILVLPMASGVPDTTGMEQAESFRALGVRQVSWAMFDREQAERGDPLPLLEGVTGVFFSGGDQSRLTAVVLHTPVHERLRALYRDGAVIGGTSAGAAVMSRIMITGEERGESASRSPFGTVRAATVVTTEGLGFVTDLIIDQHFIARRRWARLLSVVLEHPSAVGVGIDEATAIIVGSGQGFRVAGAGTVVVIDARRAGEVSADQHGNLGATGITLHLLQNGDSFSLESGEAPVRGNRQ